MRKLVISLAAAGTALAFASPATAQYYPQPQSYGYGQQYGYPQQYGYGVNNYGQVQALQARIGRVERQIYMLRDRHMIGHEAAHRLADEARELGHRLYHASSDGLNYGEVRAINYRVARLEQRVQYASANRYGGYGNNGYNGYGTYGGLNGYNAYVDRDGDGENDGDEHERWHERHDGDDRDDD